MSSPRKKRRLSQPVSLQADILSIFTSATAAPGPPPLETPQCRTSHSRRTVSFQLTSLCEALKCISKDQSPLKKLQKYLSDRVYSPTELSSALFANTDEGPDAIPPLCVLATLLSSATLRAPDLPSDMVAQRAAHEMSQDNVCGCRGTHSGIRLLLCFLVDAAGPAGSVFLSQFVAILFSRESEIEAASKFRLAELTVRFLRERANKGDALQEQFIVWVKQAVLPTRALNRSGAQVVTWTAELSGLATGRSPAEYLESRAVEEKALLALCTTISPSEATEVFLQCVSMLSCTNGDTEHLQQRTIGSWSKVVIIQRRILDTQAFADVDGTQRRSMECAVTSALCSPQAMSDLHTTAVLLCLARRLFFPSGEMAGTGSSSSCHTDHERWLKDLVRTSGGNVVKGIVKALDDVVSLEPLHILRTNHRIFSANRQHLPLCGDYLVRLRTRIGDLDPLRHRDTLSISKDNGKRAEDPEANRKAERDVTKFVHEFAETKGKLSVSLIRQMNFHRYHFRATTLRALLKPELDPMSVDQKYMGMDKGTFDEHRISMIKVMAFKRKDQALTVAEAQDAIKAIRDLKKNRAAKRLDSGTEQPDPGLNVSALDATGSLVEITEAATKLLMEGQILPDGDMNESTTQIGLKAVVDVSGRIKAAAEKSQGDDNISKTAMDLLQGIMNGLKPSESNVQMACSNLKGEDLFKKYRSWWAMCGRLLQELFCTTLGDAALRKCQKPLQYQLFTLACVRNHCLSHSAIVILSMVTCVICVFSRKFVMSDLYFVALSGPAPKLSPLPQVIFETLPLFEPVNVRASTQFALHCAYLLRAASERRYMLYTQDSVLKTPIHSSTGHDDEDENKELPVGPLLDLLRWALTSPWRFLVSRKQSLDLVADNVLVDVGSLLERIASACELYGVGSSDNYNIRDWLKIEYRCGWGRPNVVQKVLRSFEELGVHAAKLIGETSMFVAAQSPFSSTSADWIVQGMTRFAEEKIRSKDVQASRNARTATLPAYICRCIEKHGTMAALHMLDLISTTPQWYFQGFALGDFNRHMTCFLIPYFWPFSCRILKYLIGSIDRMCTASMTERASIQSDSFLISNILLKCDSLGEEFRDLNVDSLGLKDFVARTRRTQKVIDLLTSCEGGILSSVTQLPKSNGALIASSSEESPRVIGMALVLYIVNHSSSSGSEMKRVESLVSHAVGMVQAAVSSLTTLDIIDTALTTAALLPYTCCFSHMDVHESCIEVTNCVLAILLTERLQLPSTSLPAWTLERLGKTAQSQTDHRMLLLQWLGKLGYFENVHENYLSLSLAIAVCMGRIFTSTLQLAEDVFSSFLSTIDSEIIITALIPNILTIYETLTMDERRYASENLTSVVIEQLLTRRESLVSALLSVVGRILSYMQTSLHESSEAILDRILLEFPTHAAEVRLFLRARIKNMQRGS